MGGDRRDDDAGAIAWPGFVDILSAVIIMFVFFVMITAIVMYVLSIEFKKKLESENQQKVSEMVDSQFKAQMQEVLSGDVSIDELKEKFEYEVKINELDQQRQKLEKENTDLSYEVEELHDVIDQIKADMSQSNDQSTTVKNENLVIMYSKNDITLSEDTEKLIETHVKEFMDKNKVKKVKVRLQSSDNPNAPTISVSREISLARSLNARNVFLKNGVEASDIDIEYIKPEQIDESYNWIKIILEKSDE
ncbi:MAG: hypothetical protein KDI46_04040 [Alphaproteobacteria bacterium]|nr:hypothetical protein [Alphaproteobacteria bacterium]